jgi:murein tripeptide amidase MpaA
MASYDRVNWFRVPTSFDGQVMTIEHTPGMDSVYYAYFEPYSWERHLELLDRAQMSEHVRMLDLGSTVDGRDMNLLVIGDPAAKKKCGSSRASIRARRWPSGSSKACSMRCSIRPTPFGRQLLKETVFYVVPNMNPDGSVRGNLRTNAAGANLNREWNTPSMERSPEVFLVKQKMQETGCDLFLDVHGDEGLPYVFVAGSEALPNFTAKRRRRRKSSSRTTSRWPAPTSRTCMATRAAPYTDETLTMGSPHITHAFGCLSLTLELPFKDNANDPDPQAGWDGARSARLGAAVLQPMLKAIRR